MKKYLLLAFFALSQLAWAQRFPVDSMEVAVLKSAQFPQITLTTQGFSWLRILSLGLLDGNEKTFNMTAAVRIKDASNRFVTHGMLNNYRGSPIAIRRDGGGSITEIWVLTPQEKAAFEQRAAQLKAMGVRQ